ncbi:MAG: aldehyde ferredoxin oxidoreductase family protein [Alphaproteobacteria bacterium]
MAWQGRVLKIDLSTHDIKEEALNLEWAQQYLGARGLATRYLMDLMDPKTHPLAPENPLIFATGPLTGTSASTSGRYVVVTKGALTNAIASSNSGGKFGAALKAAGYDLMIVTGKSPNPVYLSIENDHIQLHDASEIWGTTVWHTDAWLHARHQNPDAKVSAIGVSGEQGVKYACIVNDLHRAAGRSGVGAVMGSKQLKAIIAHGSVGLNHKSQDKLYAVTSRWNKTLNASSSRHRLSKYGTHAMLGSMQAFGGLPTHNFRCVQFEGADNVAVDKVFKPNQNNHVNLIRNKACFGCTIGCGRIAHIDKNHFSVKDRPQYWHASGGLEYETAFALGPVVGIDDLDALTFAGYMMNEHGMDPISFGVTLAAAMELYELGAITKDQTDGIDLSFGNAEALVIFAEKTGLAQGFGRELGLGAKRLCEKYGHPELFMGVKGQEFAGYDARALQGMGLGYATSNRGACHLRHDVFAEDMADPTGKGKAKPCKDSQDFVAMVDSSGLCLFPTGVFDRTAFSDMISADLDGDWTIERLNETGERIYNLERIFNLKAGFTKADDTLPPRMLNDKTPSGTAKGLVSDLNIMLPEYYQYRGWNDEGIPTKETLNRLNLKDFAAKL